MHIVYYILLLGFVLSSTLDAQVVPLTYGEQEAFKTWRRTSPTDTIVKDIRDSTRRWACYEHRFRPISGQHEEQYTWGETLQLGVRYQRYVDTSELWRDSISDAMTRAGKQIEEIYPIWRSNMPRMDIGDALLFDLSKDTLEHRDNVFIDKYRYREAIPRQAWQLTEGDSVVAGYKCHRAECSWRGRDYVAWYSEDLPLSYGPYKFRGLPGLIVCIYDTRGDHHWSLTSFETEAKPQYIYRVPGKSEFRTTRAAFLKMKRYNAEHPGSYASIRITRKVPTRKRPRAYNPIELE